MTKISWHGEFWIPNDFSNVKVPGELRSENGRWQLELAGEFPDHATDIWGNAPLVHGLIHGHVNATLTNLINSSLETGSFDGRSSFVPETVAWRIHTAELDDIRVEEVNFKLRPVKNIRLLPKIDKHFREGKGVDEIRVDLGEDETISAGSVNLTIERGSSLFPIDDDEIGLEVRDVIRIKPKFPVDHGAAIRHLVLPFTRLNSILQGHRIVLPSVNMIGSDNGKQVDFMIVMPAEEDKSDNYSYHRRGIDLSWLTPTKKKRVLKNWYDNYTSDESAITSLIISRFGGSTPTEHRFRSLCTAVEELVTGDSAAIFEPKRWTYIKRKTLRILRDQGVTSEEIKSLSSRASYLNSTSFRDKVRALVSESNEYVDSLVINEAQFAEQVTDQRHDLSHRTGLVQEVGTFRLISQITEKLEKVISVVLIGRLGLTKPDLKKCLEKSLEFGLYFR